MLPVSFHFSEKDNYCSDESCDDAKMQRAEGIGGGKMWEMSQTE
jgi:hypothetical protein